MQRLIVCLVCLLSIPQPAFAGVSHIKSMEQSADDRFNVICLDGRTEATSTRKILDNLVCVTEGTSESISSKKVICTGDNFFDRFSVTRISDGKQIGDQNSLKTCKQLVKASTDTLVCTGDSFFDRFSVTRISDGKQIGSSSPLEGCLALINNTQ